MVVLCKYCNKEYSSYGSRSNHIKKMHKSNDTLNQSKININNTSDQSKININNTSDQSKININNTSDQSNHSYKNLSCKHCNKIFSFIQSRWKHEQKCKETKKNELEEMKEKLKQKDKEIQEKEEQFEKKMDEKMEQFKNQIFELIKQNCKVHPKTLTKINKQLNINNDNKVITNNTINNNIVVQLGHENLRDVFTKKEKIDVLEKGFMSLDYLIRYTHFNPKYPQFKNILITNLQNDIAYRYNPKTNNFDAVTKSELLEDIVSERMYDIDVFFNEHKDDISAGMQQRILDFVSSMQNKEYENDIKKDIKIILYNNRNMIVPKKEIEL
jgi:hypothetical protein